jgi:hypothetical protein
MSDILDPQVFDNNLNFCYQAGYHDGAFSTEPPYRDKLEAVREATIKHDAELRRLAAPLAPEVVAVLEAIAQLRDVMDDDHTVVDMQLAEEDRDEANDAWQAAGRPGLPAKKDRRKGGRFDEWLRSLEPLRERVRNYRERLTGGPVS